MRHLIKQKPYCGVMIGVQQVRKSSSIQVYGVGKLTSDHLTLYFESLDVDVADVKLHTEDGYAIVDFTDSTGNNAVHVFSVTPVHIIGSFTASAKQLLRAFCTMHGRVQSRVCACRCTVIYRVLW